MGYGISVYDIEDYCGEGEALDIARDQLFCDDYEVVKYAGYFENGKIWFIQANENTYVYSYGVFDPDSEWEVNEYGYTLDYSIPRTEYEFLEDVAEAINADMQDNQW